MFAKGQTFQQQFQISNEIYEGFKHIFKDENPMHISDDYAQSKGFKEKVIYGNVLNGFVSFFIGECLPVKNVVIISQEITFANPFFLNDELAFTASVNDFYESVGMVEFKFNFQRADTKIAKGKVQIKLI